MLGVVADAFAVTVPRSWFEVPLVPAHRDDAIAALVTARLPTSPALRPHRAEIVRILRRFARSAWDSGARYCAAFAEPSDDGIVSGALTVTALPAPTGTTDPITALTDRVAALGDDLHVDVRNLPLAGAAPRRWGTANVAASDGRSVPVALMQVFVPAGEHVLLVSCSSPAVDVAPMLFELFESVTDTFELLDAGVDRTGRSRTGADA